MFWEISKNSLFNRVAIAQRKQEIWMLTFPDRENKGNLDLVNLIFLHRENCGNTWNIVFL